MKMKLTTALYNIFPAWIIAMVGVAIVVMLLGLEHELDHGSVGWAVLFSFIGSAIFLLSARAFINHTTDFKLTSRAILILFTYHLVLTAINLIFFGDNSQSIGSLLISGLSAAGLVYLVIYLAEPDPLNNSPIEPTDPQEGD
jgi:hypothetical protein